MSKRPWFKFHPADWQTDEGLRLCSLSARGLWCEMLCIMHRADPYGHLVVNGKPLQARQLAVLIGAPVKDIEAHLIELEQANVFSKTDDGVVFSRRMVRDEALAQEGRAAVAKRWKASKPVSKTDADPNRVPNSPPNRDPNRVPIRDPITKSQSQIQKDDDDAVTRVRASDRVIEAVNHPFLDPNKSLGLVTTAGEVQRWIADGADLETDIIPTVRAICELRLRGPCNSWAYFRQAVRDAASRRMADPDPIQPAAARPAPSGQTTRRGGYSLAEAGLKYLAELKAEGRIDDER